VFIADIAALVDEIQGWPVVVVIGSPGIPVSVLGNRIRDIQAKDGVLEVVEVFFVGEFRIVGTDD